MRKNVLKKIQQSDRSKNYQQENDFLRKIIDNAKKKGIPITRTYLFESLKKKGHIMTNQLYTEIEHSLITIIHSSETSQNQITQK